MTDIDINKIRRLDGGLLLVFRELLRTGRASVTAERLGLSQPAISHALTRLRDLFGDPLFVRRPHGLEPTRRALELGPQVERLLGLADEALNPDAAVFDPARTRRMFRLAAPEFVAALIGGPLLRRLRDIAPGVTFGIGHADEEEARRGLKTGAMDCALGRFRAAQPGYVVEPFFEDHYCVVARRGHPRLDGAIDEAAWKQTGHVFAWAASETAGDAGDDNAHEVRALASVPHWMTVLVLVADSDAIGTVPRRLAERHADRLGLQIIDLPFEPSRIEVSVMRRAGVRDPAVDWFLGQVRAVAVA